MSKVEKIDLEKLAKELKWTHKHADYLLVNKSREIIVIVEETSRAKTDDIVKLNKTIELVRQGIPGVTYNPSSTKIIAIIHSRKKIDSMVYKLLTTRSRRNTIYIAANCYNKLNTILRSYGVK